MRGERRQECWGESRGGPSGRGRGLLWGCDPFLISHWTPPKNGHDCILELDLWFQRVVRTAGEVGVRAEASSDA